MSDKQCSKCKIFKSPVNFVRVIMRNNNAPGCDENGYTSFMKPTKQCISCRSIQNNIMHRRNLLKRADIEVRKKNSFYYINN